MAIDLKILDEKIRKLQMIRQLAADPELRPLLEEVISGGGNGVVPRTTPSDLRGIRRDVFNNVAENGDRDNYRTVKQIADRMEAAKCRFKSKNHKLTVKEQLRELEKDGLVEKAGVSEDGSGAVLWRRK